MDIGAFTSVTSQSLNRLESSFGPLPALGRGVSASGVSSFSETSLVALLSRLPEEARGKPVLFVSEISDFLSNLVTRVSEDIPLVNRILEELTSLVSPRSLPLSPGSQFPTLDELAEQLRLETKLALGSSGSGVTGLSFSSVSNISVASLVAQVTEKFEEFSIKVGLKTRNEDAALFAETPKTLATLAVGSPSSQPIPGQTSAELMTARFQSAPRFVPENARAIPYEKRPAREPKQQSALSRFFRRFMQKGESLLKTLFNRGLQS